MRKIYRGIEIMVLNNPQELRVMLYDADPDKNELLCELKPTVGVEISDTSVDAGEEYARSYIDVQYAELSRRLSDPQPRPYRTLTESVYQLAVSIQQAADYAVDNGREETLSGNWLMEFDELKEKTGLDLEDGDLVMGAFLDAINSREEIAQVAYSVPDRQVEMDLWLVHCPNLEEPDFYL